MAPLFPVRPEADRFWARVDRAGPVPGHRPELGQCWLWAGATDRCGYGKFSPARGHCWKAHRWAYVHLVGPIPWGLELDHLCRVRRCVNPAHLEPVTGRENRLRGTSPVAVFAAATHCIHGHPFDAENTIWRRTGGRDCRECHRLKVERRRRRLWEQGRGTA